MTVTEDYRKITIILEDGQHWFVTYKLPDERTLRAVQEGIPETTPNKEIQEELRSLGFEIISVAKMFKAINWTKPIPFSIPFSFLPVVSNFSSGVAKVLFSNFNPLSFRSAPSMSFRSSSY